MVFKTIKKFENRFFGHSRRCCVGSGVNSDIDIWLLVFRVRTVGVITCRWYGGSGSGMMMEFVAYHICFLNKRHPLYEGVVVLWIGYTWLVLTVIWYIPKCNSYFHIWHIEGTDGNFTTEITTKITTSLLKIGLIVLLI